MDFFVFLDRTKKNVRALFIQYCEIVFRNFLVDVEWHIGSTFDYGARGHGVDSHPGNSYFSSL